MVVTVSKLLTKMERESSSRLTLDDVCGKQPENFKKDRQFQNHYRTHSEGKFQCKECPFGFLEITIVPVRTRIFIFLGPFLRAYKLRAKILQNCLFFIILPLNFRPLKIVPGRWKFLCRWARYRYPAGQKTQVCRMNALDRVTLGVRGSYRHFKHFFPVLQLLTHI